MWTRAQFREIHAVLVAEEELHAPDAGPGEGSRHLGCYFLCLAELFVADGSRLIALAVIAALLYMSDRWAEECLAVLLCHGKQCDFSVEMDELLHDDLLDVATRAFGGEVPGLLQFVG